MTKFLQQINGKGIKERNLTGLKTNALKHINKMQCENLVWILI